MEIKRGIAVSAGVAIGPALVLDTESFRIPQRFVESKHLEEERRRLHVALAAAARDARGNQQAVTDKVGPQYGAIFAAHAHLIEDPTLAGEIEALIVKEGFAAEYAVSRVMRRHAKALESIDSGHLATRAVDLFDIESKGRIIIPSIASVIKRSIAGQSLPLESVSRDANGEIVSIELAYQNGGSQKARGVDFGIQYQIESRFGVFTWLSFEPTSAVSRAATMSKFQNQQALIEQGSKLFNPTCSNAYCHGANGAGGSAPSLRDHKLTAEQVALAEPQRPGYFGEYGGQFVPEVLMPSPQAIVAEKSDAAALRLASLKVAT